MQGRVQTEAEQTVTLSIYPIAGDVAREHLSAARVSALSPRLLLGVGRAEQSAAQAHQICRHQFQEGEMKLI